MKVPQIKTVGISLLLLGLFLGFLIPLYMYFSHDVALLNTHYPQVNFSASQSPQVELKIKRPKHWVSLSDISHYGKWAIVLSEDWGFYQHQGVDFNQLKVALSDMVEVQKFRGASTITQQLVKNVFLSPERSLWRKLHEYILSQKVENALSKNKILEVYLNSIEFGPGIYGIGKATQHYFSKTPKYLTAKESAFLAMLLPSPRRYYVSFKKKKLTPFAKERVEVILTKMKIAKIISEEQLELEKRKRLSWEKN